MKQLLKSTAARSNKPRALPRLVKADLVYSVISHTPSRVICVSRVKHSIHNQSVAFTISARNFDIVRNRH